MVFDGQDLPGRRPAHAGFEATTTVNRVDDDVAWNVPMGADRLVVAERVRIELEVQFVARER